MTARTRKPAAPRALQPPPWGNRRLVVMVGGPKDGWWFYRDDFEQAQQANARMAEAQGTPDRSRYQLTDRTADHPDYLAVGQIAQYLGPARQVAP